MTRDIDARVAYVESVRPEMDALAKKLEAYGAMVVLEQTRSVNELPYVALFLFPDQGAYVRLRILLQDDQTGSDVVITNADTLPLDRQADRTTVQRLGLGSKALQAVLSWSRDNDLLEVRGTQVGNKNSESFLLKNGFAPCPDPNPCNDFVYVIVSLPG